MRLESAAAGGTDADSLTELLVEFGRWLDHQRGLAPVTVKNYCWNARRFLEELAPPVEVSVGLLDAGVITSFMIEFCRGRNTNSAKTMARSVRSFLRFAHATGRTSVELWAAVAAPAAWHQASLPMALPAEDVERMLRVAASCRFWANGRRDYAILLLLTRLGLRRGEVAALSLDDIDWRAGEIAVVGKGASVERLPLPTEPGEAIADWLSNGRPQCQTRAVFTTMRPPGRPLSAGAVGHVVRTAFGTAGLAQIGAHRLRHTLATQMLRAGASLPEVGQVLRHRSARSTSIYAKVDQVALQPLAPPWPEAKRDATETPEVDGLVRAWVGVEA